MRIAIGFLLLTALACQQVSADSDNIDSSLNVSKRFQDLKNLQSILAIREGNDEEKFNVRRQATTASSSGSGRAGGGASGRAGGGGSGSASGTGSTSSDVSGSASASASGSFSTSGGGNVGTGGSGSGNAGVSVGVSGTGRGSGRGTGSGRAGASGGGTGSGSGRAGASGGGTGSGRAGASGGGTGGGSGRAGASGAGTESGRAGASGGGTRSGSGRAGASGGGTGSRRAGSSGGGTGSGRAGGNGTTSGSERTGVSIGGAGSGRSSISVSGRGSGNVGTSGSKRGSTGVSGSGTGSSRSAAGGSGSRSASASTGYGGSRTTSGSGRQGGGRSRNGGVTASVASPLLSLSGSVGSNLGVSELVQALLASPLTILTSTSGTNGVTTSLDSLRPTSAALGDSIEALVQSPMSLVQELFTSANTEFMGIIELAISPVTICADIFRDGAAGVFGSSRVGLDSISASLGLTLDGMLSLLSSPVTVCNEISDRRLNLFGDQDLGFGGELGAALAAILEAPLIPLLGFNGREGLLALLNSLRDNGGPLGRLAEGILESPVILADVASINVGAAVGGLLGSIGSPATFSADVLGEGIDGVIHSDNGLILTIGDNLQLLGNGLNGLVYSPVTVSNRILNGELDLEGNFDIGVDAGLTQLVNSLASPIRVLVQDSGLLDNIVSVRTFSNNFNNGILPPSIGTLSQATSELPLTLAQTLSGNVGLVLGGIVQTAISPLTLSGSIFSEGIQAVLLSAETLNQALSARVFTVSQGLIGLLTSPVTVSNRILNGEQILTEAVQLSLGAYFNEVLTILVQSPDVVTRPVIGSVAAVIGGLLQTALSPLQIVGQMLNDGAFSIFTSPVTTANAVSGSLDLTLEGLLQLISPPLAISNQILNRQPGFLTDSINLSLTTILDSPRQAVDVITGSLGLTLAGVLGTLLSPFTLSTDLAILGPNSVGASPTMTLNAIGENALAAAYGILQILSAPLTISANIGGDVDIGIQLPASLATSLDNSLQKAIKVVYEMRRVLTGASGGLLTTASAPITVIADLIRTGIDGLAAGPTELLTTTGDGSGQTATALLQGVVSPLTISSDIFSGFVVVDANGNVNVQGGFDDSLWEAVNVQINTFLQSPQAVLRPISGSLGLVLEGIVRAASSPLQALTDIVYGPKGVINDISASPLNMGLSISGSVNMVIDGLLQGVSSPLDIVDRLLDTARSVVTSFGKFMTQNKVKITEVLRDNLQIVKDAIEAILVTPLTVSAQALNKGNVFAVLSSPLDLPLSLSSSLSLLTKGILQTASSPITASAEVLTDFHIPTPPRSGPQNYLLAPVHQIGQYVTCALINTALSPVNVLSGLNCNCSI